MAAGALADAIGRGAVVDLRSATLALDSIVAGALAVAAAAFAGAVAAAAFAGAVAAAVLAGAVAAVPRGRPSTEPSTLAGLPSTRALLCA